MPVEVPTELPADLIVPCDRPVPLELPANPPELYRKGIENGARLRVCADRMDGIIDELNRQLMKDLQL